MLFAIRVHKIYSILLEFSCISPFQQWDKSTVMDVALMTSVYITSCCFGSSELKERKGERKLIFPLPAFGMNRGMNAMCCRPF